MGREGVLVTEWEGSLVDVRDRGGEMRWGILYY